MKDTFVSARLIAPNQIRVLLVSPASWEKERFWLEVDHQSEIALHSRKIEGDYLDFTLPSPLALGHSYFVYTPSLGNIPLDVSEATTFPDFDENYTYHGRLGPEYSPEETTWRVWAPLASSVSLVVHQKRGREVLYPLRRFAHGTWILTLKGNFLHAAYHFRVANNEVVTDTLDPYAKSSLANLGASVVMDERKILAEAPHASLPSLSFGQTVLYEGNVRDLTVDSSSDIVHKGLYLGLTESGKKTFKDNAFGLDYLRSLGVTHLQLQPLQDFGSVDEMKPFSQYNWGYDPMQYFVPEGSYATKPNDPESRVQEAQAMIRALHEAGIRVVLDVVYNHVYRPARFAMAQLVPNYCFRHTHDGKLSSYSGCGDDLDSNRSMVRRLIEDSAKWWIDAYGVDGFRFDLMGLIDTKTIEDIRHYGKAKNSDFLCYGEGWEMAPDGQEKMANMAHASLLPHVGFFNDRFRDAVRAYCAGDLGERDHFIYAMLGSANDWADQKALFSSVAQSINYIECHDNATYYDWLRKRGITSEAERLSIVKFGLASVLFSFGIPFLHAGQELGQTKFGNENSYNLGDLVNKLSTKMLDTRLEIAQYGVSALRLRQKLSFFAWQDPKTLADRVDILSFGDGLLIRVKGDNGLDSDAVDFLFNPTASALTYAYPDDRWILFDGGGACDGARLLGRNVIIPKHSLLITAVPPSHWPSSHGR